MQLKLKSKYICGTHSAQRKHSYKIYIYIENQQDKINEEKYVCNARKGNAIYNVECIRQMNPFENGKINKNSKYAKTLQNSIAKLLDGWAILT